MTVKELIAKLLKVDPDRIVILQKDAEGNGYSPCAGIDDNVSYMARSTWSGECGLEKITKEQAKRGFTEEDVVSGVPACVLWPTN